MLRSWARTALTLYCVIAVAAAAKPTSFCKCTCFTNSTIIPLDAHINTPPDRQAFLFAREDDAQKPGSETSPKEDEKGDGGEKKEIDQGKDDEGDRKEYRAGNCNDCTRQFCLDYNLPICKKASMEDVFTTCFQRDSRKDEAVVFIFIIATVGLLIWAAAKPWINGWIDAARERSSYIPVSGGDN